MQNYIRHLSQPFPMTVEGSVQDLWRDAVPEMALENDNLLYAVYIVSASFLLRQQPNSTELSNARQIYHSMALREQRKAVSGLSVHNADPVCLASMLIVMDAFARLEGRPHTHQFGGYTPPMDWLHMGQGSGTVFKASMGLVGAITPSSRQPDSKIATLLSTPPSLAEVDLYVDANRAVYRAVLDRPAAPAWREADGLWDAEVRDTYDKTLTLAGSIRRAMREGEPAYVVCRRLVAFAMLVPRRFLELVEEQRPRALVILAIYFCLAGVWSRSVWWLSAAEREVVAIRAALPEEWRPVLDAYMLQGQHVSRHGSL